MAGKQRSHNDGDGGASAALIQILDECGVQLDVAEAVRQETARWQLQPEIDDPALPDLTHVPFVTIDYPDSMDLDQAMHIERGADGGFQVRYALADAAHYVRVGSALMEQAVERGTSFYLPGRVVPMLPAELSEGVISLLPDVERRALVFTIQLDATGHARGTEVVQARIRSQAKLAYGQVQAFIDRPRGSELAGQPFTDTLWLLREVGELLLCAARERDVVHYDRVEAEVTCGAGDRLELELVQRNAVSRWNEQISLLCNIEGARMMARRFGPQQHVQPVYRVHEAPEPAALDRFGTILAEVGRRHGLAAELCRWRRHGPRRESLADLLQRLRAAPVPAPVMAALDRQALLTGRRSTYTSQPGLHYALGVEPYARFSAPMREVVGIFTHKEALEKLQLRSPAQSARQDEELRERVIRSANAAKQRQRRVERAVLELYLRQLLQPQLELPPSQRPIYDATVLGVRSSRLYVRLDAPPVELKVYTEALEQGTGEHYQLEQDVALVPRGGAGPSFGLGDRIQLRLMDQDQRGRFRLAPLLPSR